MYIYIEREREREREIEIIVNIKSEYFKRFNAIKYCVNLSF